MFSNRRALVGLIGLGCGGAVLTSAADGSGLAPLLTETSLVSVNSDGVKANHRSGEHGLVISATGRFVAFDSQATNLDLEDVNRSTDVYVHDRVAGATERVSVPISRPHLKLKSYVLDISADGRWVVFSSRASNLVRHDTNGQLDVFVRDMVADRTRRISVSSTGRQANASSIEAAVSRNGRIVAFTSNASNLVKGDTNGTTDVFVRNVDRHTTTRVSLSWQGHQLGNGSSGMSMSANGRVIAFATEASKVVRHDTNEVFDIYVTDRVTGRNQLVSRGPNGHQFGLRAAWADVSADGEFVAYDVAESNQDCTCGSVFLRDLGQPGSRQVSPGGPSLVAYTQLRPSVSAHGDYVGFISNFPLPEEPGDEELDGLVVDVATGSLSKVTLTSTGAPVRTFSDPILSSNGKWVAFSTEQMDVTPDDPDRREDVFVRHR